MQREKCRYWVIVASKDHVEQGVREGFAQACHGKVSPLRRMHQGDWVIYYSPKLQFHGQKCQAFTAIGRVVDDNIYQHNMSADFIPFRRNIDFLNCTEVAIAPLIENLNFLPNKKKWGSIFRFGFLEIPQSDFDLIAGQMGVVYK